ncbi:MAG: aquaporin [Gemmatimonadaceae bacterium]
MKDSWRHFLAEFIGTFALVFVGSGAIIRAQMTGGSLAEVALAHGIILSVMVTALMRISGHFNPAVTITFMVVRRIEPIMGVVYMIAQFTAAILAAYALKSLLPASAVEATRVGGQMIATSISFSQAVALELIATFFLVWVIFGTAVDPDAPRVGGFAIGLTVAADILFIGPLTGASMNPARSFGPAVASGVFEAQAIFWIGPIIGAIIAGVLYDRLFLRRAPEPVDHGAVAP